MISCLIRKKPVPATPEERVRQGCLSWMVHKLGYPAGCIAVEKEIPEVNRRLDILVYSRGLPLLVIECKASNITEEALDQLLGYRHWLKAPLAALAGKNGVKTVLLKEGKITFLEGLPPYSELSRCLPL